MYLFVEVIFMLDNENLLKTGYRPDAIFNKLPEIIGNYFC